MEYFGALPETPLDECLRIVRSCSFYVGIFAMRYGSIDQESGKSLTQLEYEEAQRLRLPSLIYLLDEERQPVLPKHVEFGAPGEKLREFKRLLKSNHVVSFFTSPEDLAVRVSQDLPALIERSGTPIHRGELAKLVESLPRAIWLADDEFAYLKNEVGELAKIAPSDEVLKELIEFLLSGERLAAVFLLARRAQLDLREATDSLMKIERCVFAVVERGFRLLEQQRASRSNVTKQAGE